MPVFLWAMQVAGVRSLHLPDGSVLLVLDDNLSSSMRCWPLRALFGGMQNHEDRTNAVRSPSSPVTCDSSDDWRREYLNSIADCMREIEALARKHKLPLVAFPLHQILDRMRLDLLWNADLPLEDAASLLLQTRAALMLWSAA